MANYIEKQYLIMWDDGNNLHKTPLTILFEEESTAEEKYEKIIDKIKKDKNAKYVMINSIYIL